jgi:beta-1,4-mannosyltransferase
MDGSGETRRAAPLTGEVVLKVQPHTVRRVAHFPECSAINPALRLFEDGLRDIGIQVVRHELLPGSVDRFSPWLSEQVSSLDVVHLHWFQRLYLRDDLASSIAALERAVEALREARERGVVLTWTAHNIWPHEQPYPDLDRHAAEILTPMIDRVFVECESAIDELVAAHPAIADRCSVVPSGSYAPLYSKSVEHVSARQRLRLPSSGRVFLAFGLIRRYKQVPELIRTFIRVFDGTSHVLVVAGEPVDEAERHRLLAAADGHPNVILRLAKVAERMVPVVIGAANHVICSYASSFNSGVLLLAASLGRVVVAPQAGTTRGVPEGVIVRIDPDPDGLSRALRTAVQSPWRAQGEAAAAWAGERTWRRTAVAARTAWNDVLTSGRTVCR